MRLLFPSENLSSLLPVTGDEGSPWKLPPPPNVSPALRIPEKTFSVQALSAFQASPPLHHSQKDTDHPDLLSFRVDRSFFGAEEPPSTNFPVDAESSGVLLLPRPLF